MGGSRDLAGVLLVRHTSPAAGPTRLPSTRSTADASSAVGETQAVRSLPRASQSDQPSVIV
ncbi:MAG TPA: hypothetical protein VIT20_07350 [Propionibacteriaceae bacterium]